MGWPSLASPHRMFYEVNLVDDIDQMLRFSDSPKHPVYAQTQLPLIITDFAEQQKIGFPQIEVRASWVRMVVAKERRQSEASTRGVFQIELRRRSKTARQRPLAGKSSGCGIPSAFGAQSPRKIVVDNLGSCSDSKDRGQNPDSAAPRAAQSHTRRHQRARLSPVWVKSLSLKSVRN